MEENKKNIIIWLIFLISTATLIVMFFMVYVGWGLVSSNVDKQALGGNDKKNILEQYTGGLEDSPFGFHPALSYSEAEKIGTQWTRGGNFPYLFWSMVDSQKTGDPAQFKWQGKTRGHDGMVGSASFDYDVIFDVQQTGLSMVLNIQPEPVKGAYSKPDSWLPVDETAYLAFVKEAVRRYSFVDYWQVGNEPNLSDVRNLRDFDELQRITYEVIKEVNPQAKVLMGGVAGNMSLSDMNDSYFEPILKKLQGKYVDIFDVHLYGDAKGGTSTTSEGRMLGYRDFKTVHDYYRNLLDKNGFKDVPIWSTEMGTFSGKWAMTGLEQTEVEQATDLIKRWVLLLSLDVKKVFWAMGLTEGFGEWDNDFFDLTGLVYGGRDGVHGLGEKKLGYYTFKLMTEKLEGSDWGSVKTIQEKDGVYIYKFTKKGKSIWVAWDDNKQEKQITISGIVSEQVTVMESVPKYKAGKDVVSYDTAFNIETKKVDANKITLTLKNTPVFIEGKQ